MRKESIHAKTQLLVVISLAVIVALWFYQGNVRNESHAGLTQGAARPSLLLYDKEQKQQIDLVILLEGLSNNNEDVREASTKRIVELGRQSDENRQLVIAELLKRVQVPDFKYKLTTLAGSLFWVEVSKIFGELNAVEAIDFLIDCLNCPAVHEYASNTYRHRPAVGTLIVLGKPAVPRLAQTLSHPDAQIRIYAADCLGNIQGDAARQALTEALPNEPDRTVQTELKRALAAIDRDSIKTEREIR